MTLPVFLAEHLAEGQDLAGGRLVLTGPEGHHAATVRRLRTGEQIEVVDGRGTRASCTVAAVGRDSVELDVLHCTHEDAPAVRVVLVQALPKGERGERAVELATEVGVDEIVPWAASRCIVTWAGERGAKSARRWQSTAREASKQARRAWLPVVHELHATKDVLARLSAAALCLVLHESASISLAAVALPDAGDVVLIVGPEGGLTEQELADFTAAGATAVRLGASVQRTSTAGAAGVVAVSVLSSRWR